MMIYVIPFFSALLVSLGTVALTRRLATRFRVGSLPSPRKIHREFKPLLGGLGFTAGLLAAALVGQYLNLLPEPVWAQYRYFWLGLLVIILTGLADDIKGLPSYLKFGGQSIAVILLILGGCKIQSFNGPFGEVFPLGIFSIPFSFLWILLVINAINLMDGLDGLAGGVSLIITTGFVLIGFRAGSPFLVLLGIGLIGGLLGFLRFNYHPASIFMGDVGSLQLGYVLAFLSIEALKVSGSHQVYFLVSLVMLGVPIVDAVIAFLRRLGQGQSPFLADKQHIHHRLLNLGLRHLETVWMIYLFTFLYVVLGVLMAYYPGFLGLLLFLLALFFALYWIWRLGYVETRVSQQNLSYQKRTLAQVRRRGPVHFNRVWHRLLLIFSDLITVNLALYVTYWLKFQSGIFSTPIYRPISDYFSTPVFLFLTLGWLLLFWLNNLYQMPWDVSRFDKVLRVSKVITFGILILGLLTADFQEMLTRSQLYSLLMYWLMMIIFVNLGRLLIIEFEKRFHLFEYAPKKTLIIGCNDLSRRVLNDIRINPHLIFDIVGVVVRTPGRRECHGLPVLGAFDDLPALIHEYRIEEVIVTLEEDATEDFIRIVGLCEPQQVVIKVPPGRRELIGGQQTGLVSHAYLRVFPENMVIWQWIIKRTFDILMAGLLLVLLSPFLLSLSVYLRLQFRKPVIVKVPVLGKNGIPFNMYVFRLTDRDYDYRANPVYLGVRADDAEFYGILRFLYRTRLYKLPQLLNVLLGDMSLVGPRPEAPGWYEEYQDILRFLHRRITVRPGLTGLAQVKYHYELSRKILQERVKYDIFYIDNLSLRLDLRILMRTLLMIFRQPGGGVPAEDEASASINRGVSGQ